MDNKKPNLLDAPLVIINIGLLSFAESLLDQDIDVIHIDWELPAGGDEEMINLLDELL
jgi:hypothetical protein